MVKKPKLKVDWSETAELQFFDILEYWTKRNKSSVYAQKLSKEVWERTVQISINPLSYVSTNFLNTRKAALGHYSIYYKITDTKILITAFWDNRQNPKKLLKILKNKKTSE